MRYNAKLRKGEGLSYGLAADMYSFGVTLFVMATGGERVHTIVGPSSTSSTASLINDPETPTPNNVKNMRLLPPEDDDALRNYLARLKMLQFDSMLYDAIQKAIHSDPLQRISVVATLHHPFFRGAPVLRNSFQASQPPQLQA